MHEFTIKEAAALLGVSDDTVRRWAEAGRVETVPGDSGRQRIDGRSLAELLVSQRTALEEAFPLHRASARNRFVGIVTRVLRDGVTAQVDLQAGPFRIVSLMTREAADELGLEPGVLAVATAKATTITIEIP